MEVILRKLNIYRNEAAIKTIAAYKTLGEVNLVMVTANADSSGTLQKISYAYGWNTDQFLTAAKKVNKRKKVAMIYDASPKVILIPKCDTKEEAVKYIDDVIDLISEEDVEVLSITHFAYIENFPEEHINLVIDSLHRISNAGVKVTYLDIESKFYDSIKLKMTSEFYQKI